MFSSTNYLNSSRRAQKIEIREAKTVLRLLFTQIGWAEALQEALSEECRNAYLHGLVDAAYDEWAAATEFKDILCDRWECDRDAIDISHLNHEFPDFVFRDGEWTEEYRRGRLFSIRDYHLAKEAIANLGEDRFERSFDKKFGRKVPVNTHLWE